MNYFVGILVVFISALMVTLIGQIPYRVFCDQKVLRALAEEKKKLKARLKTKVVDADDKKYTKIQKEIIKVNLEMNKRIIIPLAIQLTVIIAAMNQLYKLNPMFLWIVWYIGFAMFFNRMWKKVLTGVA